MQRLFKYTIICLLALFSVQSYAQERCAAGMERAVLFAKNPSIQRIKDRNEATINSWIREHQNDQSFRSVLTIPVVVHVIYNTNEENISDEQIVGQIDILNQDYRGLNADLSMVPATFQPLIADVEIEFCLAAIDPLGNPSTGITRTFTANPIGLGGTTELHYSAMGGQDAWDTERYLNIWVTKFAGGIGGISSFPGIGPADEDGVEVNYLQFGDVNVEPPYNLGRTLTHEIGHYLNLEHPWGPELTDCCEDDFVDDTPGSCETYIGQCPVHPVVSCSEPDLFMNFMFYSDDACLNMFTNGQKLRMLATLNTLRSGLLNNQTCDFVPTSEETGNEKLVLLGNPVQDELIFRYESNSFVPVQMTVVDINGREHLRSDNLLPGKHMYELKQIPAGIYLLLIESERGDIVKKMLLLPR